MNTVSLRKSFNQILFMLPNPLNQVTGYPNIQRTVVSTRQNINRRLFFHDAIPIKRSHPNHLSHYSHALPGTTLSIMNHSLSHPLLLVTSVTPHHIRHSRESGNPDFQSNVDSRFRGNDVIRKQITANFALPCGGQPNCPERPAAPPGYAPAIPRQVRRLDLAAPVGRRRLFSEWIGAGLRLVVRRW